jgi:hypothetical protein
MSKIQAKKGLENSVCTYILHELLGVLRLDPDRVVPILLLLLLVRMPARGFLTRHVTHITALSLLMCLVPMLMHLVSMLMHLVSMLMHLVPMLMHLVPMLMCLVPMLMQLVPMLMGLVPWPEDLISKHSWSFVTRDPVPKLRSLLLLQVCLVPLLSGPVLVFVCLIVVVIRDIRIVMRGVLVSKLLLLLLVLLLLLLMLLRSLLMLEIAVNNTANGHCNNYLYYRVPFEKLIRDSIYPLTVRVSDPH